MKVLFLALSLCLLAHTHAQNNRYFKLDQPPFYKGQRHIVDGHFEYPNESDSSMQISFYNQNLSLFDSIITFMKAHPKLKIEIGQHCSATDNFMNSFETTFAMANEIVNELVRQGIPENRLLPKAYGESTLIVPRDKLNQMTVDEKQKANRINERTELKILLMQYTP